MNSRLQILRENRCGVLLAVLLISLLLEPFVKEGGLGGIVLSVVSTAVVLSAVYAVASQPSHFRIALVLAVFVIATTWIARAAPTRQTWTISELTDAVIYSYIAILMLRYVLRLGHISADKLMAAVCVYLFFGFLWARIYTVLELNSPGSFSGASDAPELIKEEMTYYSFVTLTTLGYGDILPKSPQARYFAQVEAIVGVLYIAVMISRLVGLYRTQHADTEKR